MDYYEKLRKATKDSESSTLFDDIFILDKLLNSLVVKMANARRGDSYFVRSKVAKYYRDLSGDRYHDYVKRRKKTCGARI